MVYKDYWIQNTDKLWLQGNFAPFGTNIYYLQKGGSHSPDISNVMIVGNDFDSLDDWVSEGGIWTFTNGEAIQSQTGAAFYSLANRVVDIDKDDAIICESRAKLTGGSNWYRSCDMILGNVGRSDYTSVNFRLNGSQVAEVRNDDVFYSASASVTNGVYYHMKSIMVDNIITYYLDDVLKHSNKPSGLTVDNVNLMIGGWDSQIAVDWVFARKYAPVEPTVEVISLGNDMYKVLVHNNVGEPLQNYQFSIPASSVGVTASTDSYAVQGQEGALPELYPDLLGNCVAYWDFNEDVNDIIGDNDGTITGATLTTDRFGVQNRACSTDGVDDHISLPSPFTDATNFTIIAVVYHKADNSEIIIDGGWWNENNCVLMYITDGNLFGGGIRPASSSSYAINTVATVPSDTWSILTMRKTGDTLELFINDVKDTASISAPINTNGTVSWYMGRHRYSATYSDVIASELFVLTEALSDDKIATIVRLLQLGYIYPLRRSI